MRRTLPGLLLLLAIAMIAGCGGPGTSLIITSPGSSSMLVSVSDSSADQILTLQVTINSLVLTSTSNATTSLLSSPTTVEFAHLQATAQPLSQAGVPQSAYSKLSATLSNIAVTFVDTGTGQIRQLTFPGTFPLDVFFNNPITVGTGAGALNVDLNVAQSLQLQGVPNFSPMMTGELTSLPPQNQQEEDTGAVHDLPGTVSSVSSSSFVFTANQVSLPLSFDVNSNTQFVGVSGISTLTAGTLAEVSGVTQGNGRLLATRVEAAPSARQEAEGIVVSRTPASNRLRFAVQHQAGANAPSIGTLQSVLTDNTTVFTFPADEVNLTGLPFTPTFSSFTNLMVGQRVEAVTNADFNSVVAEVELAPQTLGGSAIGQAGSQYTLGLPFDSAFSLLTGAQTIDFFVQPSTELRGMTSIVLGSPVRVRGLLFFDAASGRYKLVASRVTPGP